MNAIQLYLDLKTAGIEVSFCDSESVLDVDGNNITSRPDVAAIIAAHVDQELTYHEFDKPVKTPDFIVATPRINPDPELALDEAIAELEIALSLAKYLKANRHKLK